MKKKILVSILVLIIMVGIGTMVMADEYVLSLYENLINGMIFNMVWVGLVIAVSIAGIVTLNILKKKERIKPLLYKILVIILVIVLIGFIIYEGKLIWDFAGIKPAYDYLNKAIG